MGAVYQAFDPVLEREVALKVMLPETAGDPEQKQRFEREARAVARLSHPGIVTVFDLGYHTDGSPYIVMELLKGRDLHARMREEPPLSLVQKVSIVAQVLDGLGHAHKAGVVHRDIKPANVFLAENDAARIMDFGIAFCASTGGSTSKTVVGTAGYMSPEQVHGERVDGRSDLFSVGTLLHELLSGKRPFDAETPMATFYRIARGKAAFALPPGPEYQPFLPIIQRALSVPLEGRYPTAAEFAAALRQCLQPAAPAEAETAAPAVKQAPAAPGVAAPAGYAETPERRADPSRLLALLREVYVGGKSGTVHIAVDGERKNLRVLQGQIISGTSDKAGEHMGDVMVRFGLISQTERERAVEIVLRERRPLGAVLLQQGLLERSRIEEAVGLHAREVLFGAIGRPGVSCSFEEMADDLVERDISCPVSTGQLILEATRRILDPEMVRTVLGDLTRVLVLSPDPLLRSQRITLTPADGFVLSRVDGATSARDLMALVPFPVEDAERSLFSLLCTGVVDYASSTRERPHPSLLRTRKMPPPAPAQPAAPAPTNTQLTPPRPTPTPAATPSPAPPSTPAAQQAAPAPRSAPAAPAAPAQQPTPTAAARPAEAPHADATAGRPARSSRTAEEIRALVLDIHSRLKQDHFEVLGVDRSATEAQVRDVYATFARLLHPDACRDPALEDIREEREAVFIRLSAAIEVLRDPEARAAYERAYEPSKLRSARSRTNPLASATPAPAAATPASAAPPPAPAASPTASAESAAHPTPPAPTRSPQPAAGLPEEPAASTIDPRLLPEHVLEVAERLFAAERYWDAIQQLEPMLPRAEGATRARGKALLARAYLKNPKWKKRAEGVLLSMLEENPRDLAACLLLAGIYTEARLHSRARALYQKVLELQPGNSEARKALGSLEPPEKVPEPAGIAGIFRRR
jgi:tetratricopeptide (TPR) repeat protein